MLQAPRVHLSTGKIRTHQPWGRAHARVNVGGVGLGAKILYEEGRAQVSLGPSRNRSHPGHGPPGRFARVGQLAASRRPRGAHTNGATSTAGQRFSSGRPSSTCYDAINRPGSGQEAPTWYSNDDVVEVATRAAHLKGKDTLRPKPSISSTVSPGTRLSRLLLPSALLGASCASPPSGRLWARPLENGCGRRDVEKKLKAGVHRPRHTRKALAAA